MRRNAYRYASIIESSFLFDTHWLWKSFAESGSPSACKSLLQLIYKIKRAIRTALITDTMQEPPGRMSKKYPGSLKKMD